MFREISRPEGKESGLYTQPKPAILDGVNVNRSIDIDAPLVSKPEEEESSVMEDLFEGLLYGLIGAVDATIREGLEDQRKNK